MESAFNVDLKNLLDLSIDPVHGTVNLYHLHGLLSSVVLKLNRSSKSSQIYRNVDKYNETPVLEADAKRLEQSDQLGQQIEPEVAIQLKATDVSKTSKESSETKPGSVIDQSDEDIGDPISVKNRVDSPKIEISTPNLQILNPEISSSGNKENKSIQEDDHNSTPIQNLEGVSATENKESLPPQLQRLPETTRNRTLSFVSDLWKNTNLSKRIKAAEETLEVLSTILDGVVKELNILSTDWSNKLTEEVDHKLSLVNKEFDGKIDSIQQTLITLNENVRELTCTKGSNVDNRINTLDEELNNVRNIALNLKQKMSKLPTESTFDSYVTRPVFYDGLKTMKDSVLNEVEGKFRDLNQLILNQNQFYHGKNDSTMADGRRRSIFDLDDDLNRRDSTHGYRPRSLTTHHDHKSERLSQSEFEKFRDLINNKLQDINTILINSDDMLDEIRKKMATSTDNMENIEKDIQLLKERKVDRLELKKLKEAINQTEMSEKLFQQVRQLETSTQEMKDSNKKMNDDIDILQRQIHRLQTEQNKHGVNIRQILENDDRIKFDIEKLFEVAEKLSQGKVDKDDLGTQVGKIDEQKADKEEMKDKVNVSDLNTVRLRIEAKISETLSKLDKNGLAVKDAVGQLENLATTVGKKLDKTSVSSLRKYLEKYVKKVAQSNTGDKDEKESLNVAELAAGLRKRLIEKFYCISCNSPVAKTKSEIVPSLPLQQPLPSRSTSRAGSPIKVEAVRFHQKHIVGMYDIPSLRSCGGSHTITYPHNRLNIARKDMDDSTESKLKPIQTLHDPPASSPVETAVISSDVMQKSESRPFQQLHRRSVSSPIDSRPFHAMPANNRLDALVSTSTNDA